MKQVYLVFATVFTVQGSSRTVLLNVFTSRFKAQSYSDYKRLYLKRFGSGVVFGSGVIDSSISVESRPICTLDYSSDLKDLQDEKL